VDPVARRLHYRGLWLVRLTLSIAMILSVLAIPYRGQRARRDAHPEPAYRIEEIRLPDFDYTRARAVNARGEVVGIAWKEIMDDDRPFLYRNGRITTLPLPPGYQDGWATDINDRGQIVGAVVDTNRRSRAALWDQGKVYLIPITDASTNAVAIGEDGTVIGHYSGPNGNVPRTFLWKGEEVREIGPFVPVSINHRGEIAGYELKAGHNYQAVLYRDRSVTRLPHPEGYVRSMASGVNSRRQLCGSLHKSDTKPFPAFWDFAGNQVRLLENKQGAARALDDRGNVVGYRGEWGHTSITEAMLWTNGAAIVLNDVVPQEAGWSLYGAFDINRRGQIVGTGKRYGKDSSFLLTPHR
jgi:uncharacterized membrane protein